MVPPPSIILPEEFDDRLPLLPNAEGVFAVWAGEQSAYLTKTSLLRRRVQRVLRPNALLGVATKVEYWLTGSRFESGLLHYELAKRHYPDSYLKRIKLRMPSYVRLILSNAFPRTQVTSRLSGRTSIYYGPFRARAEAEQFEGQMLDLFQIRRCQEDLEPRADHPGCMYGEMNMCLRPCQEVVNVEQYRSEVDRVADFLRDSGSTLLQTISASRDRLSEEMNFEEAARQHKRLERVEAALALREGLVSALDRLYGVAVTASVDPDQVRLWWVCQGCWQDPHDFALSSHVSLDQRLREMVGGLRPVSLPNAERQEHLALLARWFYSSWRDGEWLSFEGLDKVPYRKLVRAISRVHAAAEKASGEK